MDDATRVIRMLEEKLADLDNKVAAMATEFHRYRHDLLRSLPEDVSARIERAMAESTARFPALGPTFIAEAPVNVRQMRPTKGSPPPSVAAADTDNDDADSAAATPELQTAGKDQGPLHGVFMPTYLPLLDCGPSPASRSANPATVMDGGDETPCTPESETVAHSQMSMPARPSSVRRATDDTTSSFTSDWSDGSKGRRSALKRSSSASKPQSPRRVRFEVDGGEVLPTTAPSPTQPGAATAGEGSRSPFSLKAYVDGFPSALSILGDDEDEAPPPKKVSSSQALRALSKVPLDAGTVWTVINGQSDDETPTPITPIRAPATTLPTATSTDSVRSMETVRPYSSSTDTLRRDSSNGSVAEPGAPIPNDYQPDDDDGSSSDGEFLSIGRSKKGAAKPAATQPPPALRPLSTTTAAKPTPSQVATSRPRLQALQMRRSDAVPVPLQPPAFMQNEDYGIFDIETGLYDRRNPHSTVRPAPVEEEEDEDDDDEEDDVATESDSTTEPAVVSSSATARPISMTRSPLPADEPPTKMTIGSIGSYKGRPISNQVVLDEGIYKQAESLGQLQSFVGSVDGRSGVDADYVGSLAGALEPGLSFSGAPRSLKERMMLDDRRAIQKQMDALNRQE